MLTCKQEKFVNKLLDGDTKSDAYRKAYAPTLMTRKTIWEVSSRLAKNPKVIARLDRLSAEKEQNNRMFALSYEDRIINKLWEIVDQSNNNQIRLKALKLLGDTCGLFR